MLHINDNEYKILSNEIKYVNCEYNKVKGYTILIDMAIKLNNKKGYINIWIDFFNNKDFKNVENKTYVELPTDLDSKIDMIEIFDTDDFIDFIDSEVKVIFGNITNNEIQDIVGARMLYSLTDLNVHELFIDYMHRIQGRSPFEQTFIVQLTGDPHVAGSYLATERAVANKGYSASPYSMQVSPKGGQELVDETVKILKELNK